MKMLETIISTISDFAKDELKRNERVIILLKKFNLDPDHPPAEFSGVYNYALVEYGVGKPLAILQLFREEEIQKAFHKAFNADNPNILIEEVEKILQPDEWNILEEGIREEQIDLLHELAEFSAVFLKVVELTRTPAEVQRDRNIASLQQERRTDKTGIFSRREYRHRRQNNAQSSTSRFSTSSGDERLNFRSVTRYRSWETR